MLRIYRRRTTATLLLTALIGAVLTFTVWRNETARLQYALEAQLTGASAKVSELITRDIAFLTATSAWLESAHGDEPASDYGAVNREEFATYVRKIGLEKPEAGLQGLGFAAILHDGDIKGVARRLMRNSFTLTGIWPESTQILRTVILLIEPRDERNSLAVGYDMYTEPFRRDAIDRAIASNQVAASAPVILVQEQAEGQQTGFIIYKTVGHEYPQSSPPDGLVYSPLRGGDLFEAALNPLAGHLEMRAIDKEAPGQPLYVSPGFEHSRSGLTALVELRVADRIWLLEARPHRSVGRITAWPFTLMTAIVMLILTIAAGLASQALLAAVEKARALNDLQKRALVEKDLHLREMSHRMKNSLTRVSAMARQAARGAESKEEFVASMNKRLQAMAKAQDMLTRSETGRASLHHLIAAELAQIGSDAASHSPRAPVLSGPTVLLDPRETQAVGLLLHELATNSLKYGAGSQADGLITITWRVSQERDDRRLTLHWRETSETLTAAAAAAGEAGGAAAPEGQSAEARPVKGFGSQLIDACVKVELGGTIRRRSENGVLEVIIEAPLGKG